MSLGINLPDTFATLETREYFISYHITEDIFELENDPRGVVSCYDECLIII